LSDGHGASIRSERRPMSMFLQPLQLPHLSDGHGASIRSERPLPHVPLPPTITVAAPVGWTWDIYMDRQTIYALRDWFQIWHRSIILM
ncbi:hypothetical protein AVEN_162573-1, partial [Araneus ventricosus]